MYVHTQYTYRYLKYYVYIIYIWVYGYGVLVLLFVWMPQGGDILIFRFILSKCLFYINPLSHQLYYSSNRKRNIKLNSRKLLCKSQSIREMKPWNKCCALIKTGEKNILFFVVVRCSGSYKMDKCFLFFLSFFFCLVW